MALPLIKVDATTTGLGIIATLPIPRGTLIIAESPLLSMTTTLATPERQTEELASLSSKVDALPEHDKRAFFSLHNFYGQEFPQILGILLSNVYPMCGPEHGPATMPGSGGLFLVCSRFNHSCNPSACYSWNTALSKILVHAVKDIQPGEQVTVTYLGDIRFPRSIRQRILLEQFQFKCQCDLCTVRYVIEGVSSDARRLAIRTLTLELDSDMVHSPAVALSKCKRALQLLRTENLEGDWTYRLYLDALTICAMNGDMARASAFAVLAMDAMQVCHGKSAVELTTIRPYVKHPESHKLVGTSNGWRTRVKNKQKQNASGFEEWLWSRAT